MAVVVLGSVCALVCTCVQHGHVQLHVKGCTYSRLFYNIRNCRWS